MIAAQRDFDDRVAEIEGYFGFIAQLDSKEIKLHDGKTAGEALGGKELSDLVKTFKASAILLLYNLMESTVSNAVEAVFDELTSSGIEFDDCRMEVRQVVLSNLKSHRPDELAKVFQKLSTDIITKTFLKEKIVAGNVDAREIRGLSDRYGFARPNADGDDLVTVKSHRNDLAHGSKSFADVGRTLTVGDLKRLKDKVIAYLRAMLTNVAIYIDKQAYRAVPGES